MASTEVDPAVATAITQADKNVESKAVSATIDLYERFLHPFAEGSKFAPINEQASEDDLTSVGSESVAMEEAALSGDSKDVVAGIEAVAKEVSLQSTCVLLRIMIAALSYNSRCFQLSKIIGVRPFASLLPACRFRWFRPKSSYSRDGLEPDYTAYFHRSLKSSIGAVTDHHQDAKGPKNGRTKTTPKKRGAAKNDDESPVAKKKRATANVKKEAKDAEDNGDAAGGNLPLTPPVTPSKKGRGRKASNTADAAVNGAVPKSKGGKKAKATESAEDSTEGPNSQESPATTKSGTPRKRAAVTKDKAVARGLPTSMEQASDADKMLLHMKDVENKPWAEIRKMWTGMTSQETASSTLPNRYNRLKANLMVLKDGDVSVLRTFLAFP